MEKLYARLAHVWDELFPPDVDRHAFLRSRIGTPDPSARVVELGCATGSTAIALSTMGYTVSAGDPDKNMLAIAQSRIHKGAAHPIFSHQDMLSQLKGLSDDSAQGIICLGNTLPHLANNEELHDFFQESERVLIPGGCLIIQLMNAGRIRRMGEIHFPDLQAGNLTFRRQQKYNGDRGNISFLTEVECGLQQEKLHHELMAIDLEDWESPVPGLYRNELVESWDGRSAHADSIWLATVYRNKKQG